MQCAVICGSLINYLTGVSWAGVIRLIWILNWTLRDPNLCSCKDGRLQHLCKWLYFTAWADMIYYEKSLCALWWMTAQTRPFKRTTIWNSISHKFISFIVQTWKPWKFKDSCWDNVNDITVSNNKIQHNSHIRYCSLTNDWSKTTDCCGVLLSYWFVCIRSTWGAVSIIYWWNRYAIFLSN